MAVSPRDMAIGLIGIGLCSAVIVGTTNDPKTVSVDREPTAQGTGDLGWPAVQPNPIAGLVNPGWSAE